MVNERRPPPAWPLGWAPSCHTWVPLAPPPSKSAGRTGFFMSGFSEVASGSGQGVPFQGGLEGAFMGLGALGGIAAPWVWMEEGVTREGDWRVGRLCPCEICPPPELLRTAWMHRPWNAPPEAPVHRGGCQGPES